MGKGQSFELFLKIFYIFEFFEWKFKKWSAQNAVSVIYYLTTNYDLISDIHCKLFKDKRIMAKFSNVHFKIKVVGW